MTIEREISLSSGELVLSGALIGSDTPNGAGVLFVHGMGSSRVNNADRAQEVSRRHGATCLAIDLGGHGRSTGRLSAMTPRQNLADVVAAYDFLAATPGVDPARVGVCAASYGAYLSILLTAHRSVNRLLLRAPALYADEGFDRPLNRRHLDPDTAPTALAHMSLFPGPVMIVESERDEVIRHELIAAYLKAQPRVVHVVLRGARHALKDPTWRAEYDRIVVAYFADL